MAFVMYTYSPEQVPLVGFEHARLGTLLSINGPRNRAAKLIVFNTKFLVFNTRFTVFDTNFFIFTHSAGPSGSIQGTTSI